MPAIIKNTNVSCLDANCESESSNETEANKHKNMIIALSFIVASQMLASNLRTTIAHPHIELDKMHLHHPMRRVLQQYRLHMQGQP